ncbi:MAG: LysR family transcriptional regulator [Rhizobiales bacterium]|nr:LysR family transcriptional regulator [Hyphomicrobiales bacterium]
MGSIRAMNFAAFDLNLLRIFNALMRERSATRAGEQVGLSQPAVSAALNRLRDLLDDKLFVRQGNEMIPTPRAESLAPGIQDALESLERLLARPGAFDPAKLERSFTLMGADFFAILLVPGLVQRLRGLSSGISLRFLDTARGDVARLLSDDAIDMALEAPIDTAEWIESELLFMSPFKVIASASHPLLHALGDADTLPPEAIAELDWALRSSDGSLRGPIDEALAQHGLKRRVVLAMPHFAPLVDCVAANNLAAAIPAQFAEAHAKPKGLRVFNLPFPSPASPIKLYWHERRTRDPAHAWLRKLVHELCEPFRRSP